MITDNKNIVCWEGCGRDVLIIIMDNYSFPHLVVFCWHPTSFHNSVSLFRAKSARFFFLSEKGELPVQSSNNLKVSRPSYHCRICRTGSTILCWVSDSLNVFLARLSNSSTPPYANDPHIIRLSEHFVVPCEFREVWITAMGLVHPA